MKDRCSVVKVARRRNLGEPHNRRHRAACERRQDRFKLTAFDFDCHVSGSCGVVRQAPEDGLRATEDFYTYGFAPIHGLANEPDGFQRTTRR